MNALTVEILIVVINIFTDIRVFNIYRRTGLRSHLLLSIGGVIFTVMLAWFFGLLSLLINIPDALESNLFKLLMICSGILVLVGTALVFTKDAGALKELRRRTSWAEWMLGVVPRIENSAYPPIGKKSPGITLGLTLITLGAVLAFFEYKMGMPEIVGKGALVMFVFFLFLGCLIISFSIFYSKER